jgi:tryptophanyl-tRNA synthetase
MKRIFSGIQPSGNIHLGNYLGAIKQWVDLAEQFDESIYCVVDLHAITVPQDPKELRSKILEVAALYIACGVDPNKSAIFVQSSRPEHSELAWILNCQAKMGELYRMTQFKDKSVKGSAESAGVGLFDYPVLMAADILLYGTTHVPIGEDQKQHVELTRDLAIRFNKSFGEVFAIPEPVIKKETARIMGLDDPTKKMSKSASSPLNYIAMTDSADTIRQKIKRAVTDSGSEIKSGADKPAITNLLNIFSEITNKTIPEIENQFSGKGYGDFKEGLTEALIEYLKPIQLKYENLLKDKEGLKQILVTGSEKIAPIAKKTLTQVKSEIGFLTE